MLKLVDFNNITSDLELLLSKKDGLIFDMDGTLIDSRFSNFSIYKDVIFTMFNLTLTLNDWDTMFDGSRPSESMPKFLKTQNKNVTYDEESFMQQLKISKTKLVTEAPDKAFNLFPGAKKFLQSMHSSKKLHLVTSTKRLFVDLILSYHGLDSLFADVITGEDVMHGKPDPEGYLLSCSRTNLPKESCVIFEDSVTGIQAAANSGIDCIQVEIKDTTSHA